MDYYGVVREGGQRAKTLGFPTINIPLLDASVSGSYAGTVVHDGTTYEAILYADQGRQLLEAHLLDFSGNLYGKNIHMTLLKKLRDVEQFPNDALLIEAIQNDVRGARAYFKERSVL
jgi:riboflavin kinase/FMN adenylyltransferase